MIDILSANDLDQILGQLRRMRADHQWVEAKKAKKDLPADLWTSVSAFANSDLGGLILLGVDEAAGAFEVTGVEQPEHVAEKLQALYSQMDPPLRPQVHVVEHDGGVVIASRIEPVDRALRPCHVASRSPHDSSYIRVGDSDEKLSIVEVTDLLANRSGTDHSRRPAPDGASLDAPAVEQLLTAYRGASDRNAGHDDAEALFKIGAAERDGRLTLAGLLVAGDTPERLTSAARVAYRRTPTAADPPGARFAGRYLEGRYGVLLDDVLAAAAADLDQVQVELAGNVFNELDVPRIALREMISNALVHRSLAEPLDGTPVEVVVGEHLVVITSPGSLHVGTDLRTLGLSAMSAARNLTLVRLCQLATTPSGARVVESQASGITAADRACKRAGAMPPLFATSAARFEAVLVRRALPAADAAEQWAGTGVPLDGNESRLVAAGVVLARLRAEDAVSHLRDCRLDAAFAARLLTCTVERAAQHLGALVDAGALEAHELPDRTVWEPVSAPAAPEVLPRPAAVQARRPTMREQVGRLLAAIAASPEAELGTKDLYEPLGVTSNRAVSNVVTKALESGLVEPTREGTHDPQRRYRLTETGKQSAARAQPAT